MRLGALYILFFFIISCSGRVEPVKDYLNLHDSVSYVGKETCMQCHYDIYESYIETGMGQSYDKSSQEKSSANFDENSIINDIHSGLTYHPFWKNDTLFLKEFNSYHHRIENVDYIIGSGHHTNSHLWEENGYLHQMPFTYYTQEGKLDLPPGYENGNNTRFSRKIGLECMSCHNAYPKIVLGSENKYEYIPDGIDCERCHGAGGEHVKRMISGELVDTSKYIDYSIVNPAKLPVEKQFQICMRCHLQGNTVLAEGKSFYDFKPGMDLNEVMTVFTARYEDDETFIMASHADRLQQSLCFKNSEMSCITCHDPHHSVRKKTQNYFSKKCFSCHDTCDDKKNTINSDCISCHMPESSSSDIPHVTIHDHKIAVHNQDSISKKGTFLGLFSVNNEQPNDKMMAKAYINQYEKFSADSYLLDSASSFLAKLKVEEVFQELIHLNFLKSNYTSIINTVYAVEDYPLNKMTYDNQHAWTAYRIGAAFSETNQLKEAETYYQKAVSLAPYVLDFRMKLASVFSAQREHDAAILQYEWILNEFPKMESAWCNLGFSYLQKGDLKKAHECYNQSLELNPKHIQTLLNKAALNLLLNEKEKVVLYLERVLEVYPNHPKAQTLLKEING
ncbi:MAG: pilus assembly protein TadD [Flavobacteriales bacterium]|nr:pilus assembly protein TadD [Flavobacteriales bacterium]